MELQEGSREALYQIMLARYYSSSLGRFLAVDPAAKSAKADRPQSWNRYAYVSNNPILFSDPDGREQMVKMGGKVYMGGADGESAKGPTFSYSLTVGVSYMGIMSGGSLSIGIAADEQGGVGLLFTPQNRAGFGVELCADVSLTIQTGTVQDLEGGGQDTTLSLEAGEGAVAGVTLNDRGESGFTVGYTAGRGGAFSVNQGGTAVGMLRSGAPATPATQQSPSSGGDDTSVDRAIADKERRAAQGPAPKEKKK